MGIILLCIFNAGKTDLFENVGKASYSGTYLYVDPDSGVVDDF